MLSRCGGVDCTGDVHIGGRNTTSPDTWGLYFSGHSNLQSIVSHLLSTTTLGNADAVLLTGSSAGGMGTFHNVDWLADRLTTVPKVWGSPIGTLLTQSSARAATLQHERFSGSDTTVPWVVAQRVGFSQETLTTRQRGHRLATGRTGAKVKPVASATTRRWLSCLTRS